MPCTPANMRRSASGTCPGMRAAVHVATAIICMLAVTVPLCTAAPDDGAPGATSPMACPGQGAAEVTLVPTKAELDHRRKLAAERAMLDCVASFEAEHEARTLSQEQLQHLQIELDQCTTERDWLSTHRDWLSRCPQELARMRERLTVGLETVRASVQALTANVSALHASMAGHNCTVHTARLEAELAAKTKQNVEMEQEHRRAAEAAPGSWWSYLFSSSAV